MKIEIKTESNIDHWNIFFSSLAYAEKAAADQCRVISELLTNNGNDELATRYKEFAADEDNHFAMAKQLCAPLESPTSVAQKVYRGGLMNPNASALERMAMIHLVFEPSALAFLGFLRQHADQLSCNPQLVKNIETNLAEILKDEVGHVYGGKTIVLEQIQKSTEEEIKETKKSIRRHRAFLVAGLKSFFKHTSNSHLLVQQMLEKFDFYFEKSNRGIFA